MPTFQIRHGKVLQTVTYANAGAFRRTLTPRWLHGPMRRDIVTAGKLGNSYQPVVMENAAQLQGALLDHILIADPSNNNADYIAAINGMSAVRSTNGGGVTSDVMGITNAVPAPISPIALDGAVTMKAKADVQCAKFDLCDDFTHTGSRADPQLRCLMEYWDSATEAGLPQVLWGVPTSGDYDVVIASNQTLTVGQLVTSPTAFPVAAMVVAIKQAVQLVDGTGLTDRHGTTVTLSKKALSSTAELLTFTGANLLAWHTPEGDIAGGGTFSYLS